MSDRTVILHDFESPRKEVNVKSDEIIGILWASLRGGSRLMFADGSSMSVDENPNHVSLISGFIKENQCAIGSHSGMYYYHPNVVPDPPEQTHTSTTEDYSSGN